MSHQEENDIYEQDSRDATKGDSLQHSAVSGRAVAVGVVGPVPNAQPLTDGHSLGLPQLQERGVSHCACLPGEQDQADVQGSGSPLSLKPVLAEPKAGVSPRGWRGTGSQQQGIGVRQAPDSSAWRSLQRTAPL